MGSEIINGFWLCKLNGSDYRALCFERVQSLEALLWSQTYRGLRDRGLRSYLSRGARRVATLPGLSARARTAEALDAAGQANRNFLRASTRADTYRPVASPYGLHAVCESTRKST